MIDPNLRAIITPELTGGEELLWAEKTNAWEKQSVAKGILPENKSRKFRFGFVMSAIALIVSGYLKVPIMPHVALMFAVLFGASILLDFIVRRFAPLHIGGYALTNRRLFELGLEFEIIRYLDASRIQTVYEGAGVTIRPIGRKGNKAYTMHFMDNVYPTIGHIDAAIKRARAMT